MLTLPLVLLQTIYLISKTERIFDRDMTHCYRILPCLNPLLQKKMIYFFITTSPDSDTKFDFFTFWGTTLLVKRVINVS